MSPFLLPRPTARFVCGPTRFAALRLGITRIRTGGALSYDAGVVARLTHEVEERRDAPDTSANRAHRFLAASAPVMDRLERELERAHVAVVLSDDRARVVDRRAPDDAVRRSVDAAMLMQASASRGVLLGRRQPGS
jgi:hypothetical protein